MKIAGFTISKKVFIILGVLVLLVFVGSMVSSNKEDKEKQERQAELDKRAAEAEKRLEAKKDIDKDELVRQKLIEKFGEPPEGFMWNDEGELYALSDDGKTAEEVVYTYIRAISMQDFSTAQKYAKKSQIIRSYNRYYDDAFDADYYNLFLRKQYKFSLLSIELVETTDSAVFADGTTIISMKLKVLDLTNKDFWRPDAETIYKTVRSYKKDESDDTKSNQYLYDYVYNKYEDGTVGKKEVVVGFKLTKKFGSGWLIEDDSELNHHLLYEEGLDIVPYIRENFAEWLDQTVEAENDAAELQREKEQEKLERQMEKEKKKK